MHADHIVCDLTTLDAMIQRLGRVNRRRRPRSLEAARVDVVVETTKKGKEEGKKERSPRLSNRPRQARELLSKSFRSALMADMTPVREHFRSCLKDMSEDAKHQAFAPQPGIAPLTDILMDAWALTSIREALPGKPEVAPYLHGLLTA